VVRQECGGSGVRRRGVEGGKGGRSWERAKLVIGGEKFKPESLEYYLTSLEREIGGARFKEDYERQSETLVWIVH